MTPADPAQLALSIRRAAKAGDAPLDIFAFINERDDVVLIRRFSGGNNIDGIYAKDPRSGLGFIYLNRAKPLGRQHFTAAHELGHHVLGHHDELDVNVFARSKNAEETAANRFAAELLIPRAGLVKFVSSKKLDVTRLDDAIGVAQHYGVTLQPALIQLRALDRVSGPDCGRLIEEYDRRKTKPLTEWEAVDARTKTHLSPRFLKVVQERYLRGEMTAEAASEAIDTPIEVVIERFGSPPARAAAADLADLI